MQSFSLKAKTELCRLPVQRHCCSRAESYGVLLYCNTFSTREIRIITENPEFAVRLPRLFHKAFGVRFDRTPEDNGSGKLIFQITEPEKLRRILDTFGYDAEKSLALHVNYALLEDDCCRASFLRGAFLAGGSVTDPEKRYHLELCTSHVQANREVLTLLEEMGFLPRVVMRGAYAVTYFKQSEHIEDILTTIGAPVSATDIMTAKVDKEIRNDANRATNCDIANLNKTLEAVAQQTDAIRRIADSGKLKALPDKLQETAQMRLANPELSLAQLATMFDPPISKSCLNHRMRKIMEVARNEK